MKTCTVCGKPIPPERLELSPNTVTCSKPCSRQNTRNLSAAASRRYYQRRKEREEEES